MGEFARLHLLGNIQIYDQVRTLSLVTAFEGLTKFCRHKFFSGNSQKPDTTLSTVPVTKPTFLPAATCPDLLRATWLGHACYFVEFPSGLRVLFDPVFEERCSPFSWMGHKRFTPTPCDISDIPIIDCVGLDTHVLFAIMPDI